MGTKMFYLVTLNLEFELLKKKTLTLALIS